MQHIMMPLFVVLGLAWPFLLGFFGANVLGPVLWSVGIAIFAIGTGWRAPNSGIIKSTILGLCLAVAVCVPVYLLGRWLA